MKQKLYLIIAILCALAGTAHATEKTVTYAFTAENTSSSRWTLTFTPNNSGFGYSTGAKTATIPDVASTPITYTLRLHHNDGTDAYTDMAMTYDQAQNIQSISRTGYTFDGWSTAPDGDVVYTDGEEVSNLTATNGATVDLYAQWTDVWGVTQGKDGSSAEKAYTITTTAGLDLLAHA